MDGMSFFLLAAENGQQAAGPKEFIIGTVLPIVLFLVVMYLILIRPQQKRNREHQELINRLKAGDRVVTSSGIHGTIKSVEQGTIELTVAENVNLTISKQAVGRVLEETSTESENSS